MLLRAAQARTSMIRGPNPDRVQPRVNQEMGAWLLMMDELSGQLSIFLSVLLYLPYYSKHVPERAKHGENEHEGERADEDQHQDFPNPFRPTASRQTF